MVVLMDGCSPYSPTFLHFLEGEPEGEWYEVPDHYAADDWEN